ncbi:MAG TPA: MFS transporter [Solirubrobacterales bacterium]|jgi:predicted MFS family arabinose efflux permease
MANSSRADADPAPALFLCLFAVQAAVIALSPVLAEVAAEFDVSTATAGQLRSVSGLIAGFTAVAMGRLSGRVGLRELLLAGLAVLGAGSLLSAAAPEFAVLALAQVAVGAGIAMVLSGGLAAAAEWSLPEQRARVLSWALLGQPFAWIVGMPAIGLLGESSWRWGWLAVPFLACALAFAAVARRPTERSREPAVGSWRLLTGNPRVAGWALGELFAWSAWAGTLVFAGALFVESYGVSTATAGFLLGLAAVAYLPGNLLARRHVERSARLLAAAMPPLAALIVAVFGAWRPAVGLSAAALALLAFVAAARTIAGSALGLEVCSQRRVFAMRIRTAATQFGYLLGSALGGIALAAGGYGALGAVFAVMFLLAAVPHAAALAPWTARRSA